MRLCVRYCEIVQAGLGVNPEPPPPPEGKRGRVKRSKPLNLLIRLEDRHEEAMGFFGYGHVPFDNKLAERDLRMMKTREKICLRLSSLRSGCGTFRGASRRDGPASLRRSPAGGYEPGRPASSASSSAKPPLRMGKRHQVLGSRFLSSTWRPGA